MEWLPLLPAAGCLTIIVVQLIRVFREDRRLRHAGTGESGPGA